MFIPSHLLLSRHNIYYFRLSVPAFLHPQGKQSHIKLSLGTRDPREALRLSRHLAYHAGQINWHLAVGMNFIQIKAALQAYFASELEDYKSRRAVLGPLPKWREDYGRDTLQTLEKANAQGVDGLMVYYDDVRVNQEISKILQFNNMNVSKDSIEYGHFLQQFPLAYAQFLRDMLAYDAEIKDYAGPKAPISTSKPIAHSVITLQQAVNDFIDERKRGEAWTDRTLKDRTRQLALLCELIGADTDLSNINALKAAEVKKTLQALPKNRSKNPKTRHLTVQEMAKVTGVLKMNTKTVNEYLTVYQSLFGWAEQQGYIQKNIFNGLQVKIGKAKVKARVPFKPDQIKAILAALPEHTPEKTGKTYRYWGVMLAIYTGARLNEIAQLALDDIQQENGVWYFNITDEGEDDNKHLKNESSKRRVPAHAALLDAGLIERVQELRAEKQVRLFPDLEYQQGHGYGRGLTRWVNTKFLVELGMKEAGITFHGFRHSFITGLRQAGVELPTVQEIVGHAKDGVTETVYNATAYPLPILKTAIDKLSYRAVD